MPRNQHHSQTWRARLLGGLIGALLLGSTSAVAAPRIAIIIDDIGYSKALGERALRLPGAITYAFIADAPHAPSQARSAAALGKQVMLHVPMQPHTAGNPTLHPHRLRASHSAAHVAHLLEQSFLAIPQAVGVNNHQGSSLTEQTLAMDHVMQVLRHRRVFFVDSVTSGRSVAMQRAVAAGVPAARRDVFLDNTRQVSSIRKQLKLLERRARRNGQAIAIGHPYPETLAVLEQELPRMAASGLRVVPASQLANTATGAAQDRTLALHR